MNEVSPMEAVVLKPKRDHFGAAQPLVIRLCLV